MTEPAGRSGADPTPADAAPADDPPTAPHPADSADTVATARGATADAELSGTEPVDPEPAHADQDRPVDPGPGDAEPVDTEPVDTEPVDTDQDDRGRTGPGLAEILSTAVVVVLVALAVFALWPRGSTPTETGDAPTAIAVSDTELAPLRAAVALPTCPPPTGAPAAGPLAGVVVGCLGTAGPVDLGAVTAGRPSLVTLWASWCGPCRQELPALAEYAARPDAVPVLLVDVDDDPRSALRLLAELGVDLPSALDSSSAVRTALDVPLGLPYSYVVRADGSVERIDPPVAFATADEVAAAVDRLVVP